MPAALEIKQLLEEYGSDQAVITVDIENGLQILVYPSEEQEFSKFQGDDLAHRIATLCLGTEAPITAPIPGMFGYELKELPR